MEVHKSKGPKWVEFNYELLTWKATELWLFEMFSLWAWGRGHGKVWGQIWMHFHAKCQVHSWKNDKVMATWTLYPTLLGKFLLHGDIVANWRKSIWPICSTDTKLLGRLGDNLLSIIIFLRHFKVIKKNFLNLSPPRRWNRTTVPLDTYRFEACTPDHRGSSGQS